MFRTAIAFIILLSAQLCMAATIHIPADSATIQAGINGAVNGDTVLVAKGVWDVSLTFLGKQIVVISEEGPDSTSVGYVNFTTGDTLNPVLSGFMVVELDCGGMSNPLISDCKFIGYVEYQPMVEIWDASPVFQNCLFKDGLNLDTYGGACYVEGRAVFDGCVFQNNYARLRGCAIYASDGAVVEAVNCEFIENVGAEAGACDVHCESCDSLYIVDCFMKSGTSTHLVPPSIYIEMPESGKAVISNCTITGYSAGIFPYSPSGAIYMWTTAPIEISNVLLTSNIRAFGEVPEEHNISMVCCSFFDNGEIFYTGSEFGTDYFIADPLFCDTANGDYSIADNSSCAPAHSPCGQLIGKYGVNCTAEYICGDANRGGDVNISDAVFIINYVFVSGSPWPSPMQAADVNCVGSANVSDAVYIINYIFVGGNAPCDTNGDGQPDC